MTIASTSSRNRAVLALWRAYHSHAKDANEARLMIDCWPTRKRMHERDIETNDRAAVECLDILSQVGEDVSRIPRAEDIEAMERKGE